MIKNLFLKTTVFFLVMLTSQIVAAHDYWLVPDSFTAKEGENLTINLVVGDKLVTEKTKAFTKSRTKSVTLSNAQGTTEFLNDFTDGTIPFFNEKLTVAGLNMIALEGNFYRKKMTHEEFTKSLIYGEKDDILALRKQLPHKDIEYKHYARSIKTLVNVGESSNSDLYKKVLGHQVEIVLLQNPFTLKTGDKLNVQFIERGKPLVNQIVRAFNGDGKTLFSTQKQTTNNKGIASFDMNEKGNYVVNVSHLRHCPECADVEWEGYISSFSFSLN